MKNKPVTINSIFAKLFIVFRENTSYSNATMFILCQYQNWSTQSVHIYSIINLEIKYVDNLKKNFLTVSIAFTPTFSSKQMINRIPKIFISISYASVYIVQENNLNPSPLRFFLSRNHLIEFQGSPFQNVNQPLCFSLKVPSSSSWTLFESDSHLHFYPLKIVNWKRV